MFTSNASATTPEATRQLRGRALSQVIDLDEGSIPFVSRLGTLLGASLVFGGVAWSAVTPLVETARTEGSIVPADHIHRLQHLEGGIVEGVHVRDGDHVEFGDLLIELSPSASASEVEQIEARVRALEARLGRLDALLSGAVSLPAPLASDQLQQRLFTEQRAALEDQLAVELAEGRRLEKQLASRLEQERALAESVELLRERQRLQLEAQTRGAIARVDALAAEANLAQTVGQLRAVQAEISSSSEAITAVEGRLSEIRTRWRQELRLESEQVLAELEEARAQRSRLADRLARTSITAPAAGIVQGLSVHTLSSVVEPGAVVLELVPMQGELVAETRVEPKDIGYLRPGQRVDVTVAGFEAQRFGSLEGRLKGVSASTYLDGEGRPFYQAEILLERAYLGSDPQRNRLVPGMLVSANIRTGEKTVLEYLLKPVYRGLDAAMRER